MGKSIVVSMASLDGFYEGPGGDLMLLPFDGGAFEAYNLERLEAAHTVLLGARSFAGFSHFWPAVEGAETASPAARRFSSLYQQVDKVVVSDHPSPLPADHAWATTTRVVPRAAAHAEVAHLRQGGGEIVTWGSRTLWHDLMHHGLVDELHLVTGAIVVGDGVPVFDTAWQPALRLIDCRGFDGSDDVLLRYRVVPDSDAATASARTESRSPRPGSNPTPTPTSHEGDTDE